MGLNWITPLFRCIALDMSLEIGVTVQCKPKKIRHAIPCVEPVSQEVGPQKRPAGVAWHGGEVRAACSC